MENSLQLGANQERCIRISLGAPLVSPLDLESSC